MKYFILLEVFSLYIFSGEAWNIYSQKKLDCWMLFAVNYSQSKYYWMYIRQAVLTAENFFSHKCRKFQCPARILHTLAETCKFCHRRSPARSFNDTILDYVHTQTAEFHLLNFWK